MSTGRRPATSERPTQASPTAPATEAAGQAFARADHPGPDALLLPPATAASLANAAFVAQLYELWREERGSLPASWDLFFQGFELGRAGPGTAGEPGAQPPGADRVSARVDPDLQARVDRLVSSFRSQGHLLAQSNPLEERPPLPLPLLLASFGLTAADLEREVATSDLLDVRRVRLGELIARLQASYCRHLGVEFTHVQDASARRWLQYELEAERPLPDAAGQRRLLDQLLDAELFESFLQGRYPGHKRFSLEGAEALLPALHAVLDAAPPLGVAELVLGMAHRGRLNVLANILDQPFSEIFARFEDLPAESRAGGTGDVKYHLGYATTARTASGVELRVSLTPNPSHLEAVDPVVLGRCRALQRRRGDTERRASVLPLLIHGDAAFAGQGIVAETLQLSELRGYRVGGTLHLIVNNQIGFTTTPADGRSSKYASDMAKLIEAPILHVNGEDPEAVVHAVTLALRYRQRFGRDVVVDLLCYRRHGHNESDEPAFTQPQLYRALGDRPPLRRLYAQQLVARGVLDAEEERRLEQEIGARLQRAHAELRQAPRDPPPERPSLPNPEQPRAGGSPVPIEAGPPEPSAAPGPTQGLAFTPAGPWSFAPAETRVERHALLAVARALTSVPAGFRLNPKLARRLPEQFQAVEGHGPIGWPLAELLAFGTLLAEGTPVRLSGQDCQRGTFSSRHAVWHDLHSDRPYTPLEHVADGQARFCIYNSALSEAAVLGFDWGYSIEEPAMLVLWEAQFGDFANGAQVIIDQFVTSSLAKWGLACGLVLLLPHGQEGQGPEHSDARLERWLQACAQDNLQVCNLSTPAQYFHALRRQVRRPFRRPLVIMTPKSMLRHPACVSRSEELVDGAFAEVLDDPRFEASAGATAQPTAPSARPTRDAVRRVVCCSGKLYYELEAARARQGRDDIALLRIEQLYPLHDQALNHLLARYPAEATLVWAQEETRNRGAWTFIEPRLRALAGRQPLYAGRPEAASPALGSAHAAQVQQERLIAQALG